MRELARPPPGGVSLGWGALSLTRRQRLMVPNTAGAGAISEYMYANLLEQWLCIGYVCGNTIRHFCQRHSLGQLLGGMIGLLSASICLCCDPSGSPQLDLPGTLG